MFHTLGRYRFVVDLEQNYQCRKASDATLTNFTVFNHWSKVEKPYHSLACSFVIFTFVPHRKPCRDRGIVCGRPLRMRLRKSSRIYTQELQNTVAAEITIPLVNFDNDPHLGKLPKRHLMDNMALGTQKMQSVHNAGRSRHTWFMCTPRNIYSCTKAQTNVRI